MTRYTSSDIKLAIFSKFLMAWSAESNPSDDMQKEHLLFFDEHILLNVQVPGLRHTRASVIDVCLSNVWENKVMNNQVNIATLKRHFHAENVLKEYFVLLF